MSDSPDKTTDMAPPPTRESDKASDSSTATPRLSGDADSHDSPISDEKAAAAATPAAANPQEELKDFEREPAGKRAVVMLALCMAVFLAALDVTIVTTAIPTIVEHFNSSSGYVWIGSGFLLANAASVPIWGKFSEIFGRKPVLLAANLIFFVGSLVAALANSIGMLIAGRAVQGLGAGGLVILVNIIIADLFSLRNRGPYYGIIGGVWAFASAVGPILGGVFAQKVSWRWCFYINLPLDGLAFIIILFLLDIKTPKTPILEGLKAIDWIGALLVVAGTLMFLFGLEFGGSTHPWDSAEVLCLIIIGVFTWVLFIIWELKIAKYQLIPVQIFKSRSVAAAYFTVFIHGFVFIGSFYYLPLYFQASLGKTPILSGVYLLPNCGTLTISSIFIGVYIRKTGRFLDCMYFGFFMLTLGNGLLINLQADSSIAKIMIYQLILGFGVGPLFQSPVIAIQSHVKPREIALATSTLAFIRQLATSISVVIGGVIYESLMKKKRPELIAALGQNLGTQIGGGDAGALAAIVRTLPEPGRRVAEFAFGQSLSKTWILYTVMAFLGLITVPLVAKKTLTTKWEENKTGLEAEKEKAAERKREAAEKLARKNAKNGKPVTDVELENGVQQKASQA